MTSEWRWRMGRSYDDIMADRMARMGPEADAQREVLERNYDIATQVMDLRLQHGLTQAELAELCGMGQPDISRIERGSTSPTTVSLQKVAAALDAEVRLVPKAS